MRSPIIWPKGDRSGSATFGFPIRDIVTAADAYLVRHKMRVIKWIEAFPEKIADMSYNDEDDIGEVGRQQDIVRWVVVKV